jgi:hypothetical protein
LKNWASGRRRRPDPDSSAGTPLAAKKLQLEPSLEIERIPLLLAIRPGALKCFGKDRVGRVGDSLTDPSVTGRL